MPAPCSPLRPSIRRRPNFARTATALLLSGAMVGGVAADPASSGIDGLVAVPLTRLPPPPAPVEAGFCDHLKIEPRTPGGTAAEELGWAVTGEVPLQGLDVVSFVGGFEQGTSGSCRMDDGNVAVFDGDRLRWLVYGEQDASHGIGTVEPFEDTGVRIWSGDFLSQPVADMHIDEKGAVSLSELAAVEQFCNDMALVPNIYGMPITEAREELTANGWGAVLGIPDGAPADPRSEALKADGIYEVDACSPTGFGYCTFGYSGYVAELSVVTFGDDAKVARYAVSCTTPGAE